MKVLHVIPSVGPLRGGPSRGVLDMCKGLASAGVDITLATTDDNGPDHLDVPFDQPVPHDGYETLYFRRQARPYTISVPLLSWLDRNAKHFDLVHIHAVFSHVSDFAPRILRAHHKPYGIIPWGILSDWGIRRRRPLIKRLFYLCFVRANLRQAAFVHLTSAWERHQVPAQEHLSQAKVIPLGISLDIAPRVEPHLEHKSQLRLLFLSRIDPIKGLDLLFQAIAQMQPRKYPVHLTIAGDGESGYVSTMRDLATQLGIAPQVEWVGFVTGETKQAIWRQADVFVLPSCSESFGFAPVEAIAAGLPVLISDRVGVAPEIERANAGLVVPCEVDALVSALEAFADDSDLRHQMGTNGQQLAREKFSIEATTRSLIALYEDVLQQMRQSTR